MVATDLAMVYGPLLAERAERAGLAGRVSFEAADGEALPCPDASFDAVTCSLGLMFMPHAETAALAEARRVLKPGGVFAATVWQSMPKVPFMDVMLTITSEFDPSAVSNSAPSIATRFGDGAELADAVAAAGFKDVTRTEFSVDFRLAEEGWWAKVLEMPFPLAAALAAAEAAGRAGVREEAREKVQAAMEWRGWFQPDGSIRAGDNRVVYISGVAA